MSVNANPANAGAVAGGLAAGATGDHTTAAETVCVAGNAKAPVPTGAKHFVVTEDHAIEKERVETWTEHTPIHREYVTKVEATGRINMPPGYIENATVRETIVGEHTCFPTNTTTVTGVAGETKTLDHVANTGYTSTTATTTATTATTSVPGHHL